MRAGALDVVVVAPLPGDEDGLGSVVLRDEKLCLSVAANHPFAARASIQLRQAVPAPVFEGDTIYSQSTVLMARPIKSHLDTGIVKGRTVGYNELGTVVISFIRTLMVFRRGHSPAPACPQRLGCRGAVMIPTPARSWLFTPRSARPVRDRAGFWRRRDDPGLGGRRRPGRQSRGSHRRARLAQYRHSRADSVGPHQ